MENISCGRRHSLFIDPQGVVWTSGCNDYGQLGLSHSNTQYKFSSLQNLPPIVQVSGSMDGSFSLFLDDTGSLWGCGINYSGQLGDNSMANILLPTIIPNLPCVVMVSCGADHSVVLDGNGCIWGAGCNEYGQLSLQGAENVTKFTRIDTSDIGIVSKIRCGFSHTIVESEIGELWSTGLNNNGQLGVGNKVNGRRFQKAGTEIKSRIREYLCGSSHSVVLDIEGRVWVTGSDGSCVSDNRDHFTLLENIPFIRQIISGGKSIMMVDESGWIYELVLSAFKFKNDLGIQSDISAKLERLPVSEIICGVSAFSSLKLLVDKEGDLWVCGSNKYGEIGLGKETTYQSDLVKVPGESEYCC